MLFDPYTYDLTTSARQPSQPGAGARGAALAADVLLEVPQQARSVLWHGLTSAVSGALDVWERTPSGRQRVLPAFSVQHAGKRRFHPADLRQHSLASWHRLLGIELRLAVEALEALIQRDEAIYRAALAEQCARVGQLYSELARRAGEWVAEALLRWELRLLRCRASPALAPLIYN